MENTIVFTRILNGLDYQKYHDIFEKLVQNTDVDSLNDEEKELYDYTKLNLQRSNRVSKTYKISESFQNVLETIQSPQIWLVLTENWCGDSAQSLPQIAKIADSHPNITLKILQRDENLDIMDQYLSDGKRGIPKLVAFDNEGNELFQWGPRPQAAEKIVKDGFAAGHPKEEVYPLLHGWYAKNRGKAIEAELIEVIQNT